MASSVQDEDKGMNTDFKTRLKEKAPLIGTLISWPFPETAEIASNAGFDWLFLDWEHGLHDVRSLQQIVQAIGEKCAAIIRVPANDPVWIGKALDTGAAGLIIPHIESAENVERAIQSAKYPPRGIRSVGVARAQGYGHEVRRSVEEDNRTTVVIAQIEHIKGVGEIERIAAVQGLDAVFIGPFDLSGSMGKPGRIADADVREAIGLVRKACTERGLPVGIFAPDAQAAKKALEEGYTLVCAGTDAMLHATVLRQILKEIRF